MSRFAVIVQILTSRVTCVLISISVFLIKNKEIEEEKKKDIVIKEVIEKERKKTKSRLKKKDIYFYYVLCIFHSF